MNFGHLLDPLVDAFNSGLLMAGCIVFFFSWWAISRYSQDTFVSRHRVAIMGAIGFTASTPIALLFLLIILPHSGVADPKMLLTELLAIVVTGAIPSVSFAVASWLLWDILKL